MDRVVTYKDFKIIGPVNFKGEWESGAEFWYVKFQLSIRHPSGYADLVIKYRSKIQGDFGMVWVEICVFKVLKIR